MYLYEFLVEEEYFLLLWIEMDAVEDNEAQLKKQIEAQGNIVRQLKASKAPKEQVT